MRGRGLVGPVFVIESLVASRRWQLYAGRAAFVAILLGVVCRRSRRIESTGARG